MLVRVAGSNDSIEINCGNGRQTFKWLAAVLQGRLKYYHVLRKSMTTDSFIVTEIRNMSGELINPADQLYEHYSGNNINDRAIGLEVIVTVASVYPVDDWGKTCPTCK